MDQCLPRWRQVQLGRQTLNEGRGSHWVGEVYARAVHSVKISHAKAQRNTQRRKNKRVLFFFAPLRLPLRLCVKPSLAREYTCEMYLSAYATTPTHFLS